ncbi:CsgG/HfaB family protein [Pectinatus frisingensis]|uniref:CsgG/HfaB family protein n=1 Tax=Pectinatus frisingensis TaxID=865 RepID=UPI0018C845AD
MLFKNSSFLQINLKYLFFSLTMFLMLAFPFARVEAQESLSVLPFKSIAGPRELGSLLTNQLMADLSGNSAICLVDRGNIKDILDEQGLGKTGVIAKNTAIQMGKVHGVDYLLTGGVFSPQNVLPRKGVKYPATRFNVSWKLIDTTTGQIVLADTNSKEVPKILIKQDGRRVWITPSDAAGNALRDISHDISQLIQQKMARHTDTTHVAFVDGDTVYIDGGRNKNVSVDEIFSIVQDGVVIRDPETGKSLGYQQKVICKIQIERVNDDFAYGKVIAGSSNNLQIGNVATAS